jgi:hypothetical protein
MTRRNAKLVYIEQPSGELRVAKTTLPNNSLALELRVHKARQLGTNVREKLHVW